MSQENEEVINQCISPIIRSRSPSSPNFSRVYSRTMIKSMENILIEDSVKDKSPNKKSLDNMRRSVTLKDISEFKYTRRSGTNITYERIKTAKLKVDDAILKGKVFAVLGPYKRVREVLRNRGWVERFYLNPETLSNSSTTRKSISNVKSNGDKNVVIDEGDEMYDDIDDDDIDDDNSDGDEANGLPPWEEDDGIYGVMSRMLKNTQPNLFWTLRKSQIDYKNLRRDQMINHHAKAGSFTTKTGLAKCLNQLRWYDDKEPDEFFPRCFTISTLEEKHAFIDDFHFTACVSLIKDIIDDSNEASGDQEDSTDHVNNYKSSEISNGKVSKKILPKIKYGDKRKERNSYISHKFLDMAIAYCEFIMKIKNHEDIDRNDFIFCWSCDWEEFLNNYYKVVHEGFRVEGASGEQTRKRCLEIAHDLKKMCPQFDMEGSRNVWILKPGAKSRGRGIMCYSRLCDVLKLLTNSYVANENKFIVQKYIERPLLIYNTKFDIRQWFMVTDWNPLTVWWYKDCYLRFCSQQYTLDDFNEAVHLSNNSIQYKYQNGPRSELLPPENMWDWLQFENWMKSEGYGNAYRSIILPGMKEAVIDVMLCVQDNVEWRKNTFELYGADFMVSENDLKPWLIEINSSPCMSPSTPITARLTSAVIDDIFKVILDRRDNRQCDTGAFELVYKQNAIFVPPYIGIDLKLAGTTIKNPVISTLLTERRSSNRPITDSIIFRKMKNKDHSNTKRASNETSLVTSKKDSPPKVTEKTIPSHKRSNTTVTLSTTQIRARSSSNNNPISQTSPTSSGPKKQNESSSTESSAHRKVKSPPSVPDSPTKFVKHDELSTDSDLSFPTKSANTIKHLPIKAGDYARSKYDLKETSNLSNNSVKDFKLPVATKIEITPKVSPAKSERQYKLPTKVELVNFTLSKNVINSSLSDLNMEKKRKSTKLFKRPSNTQMFIQRYSFARADPSNPKCLKLVDKDNEPTSISIVSNCDLIPRRSRSKSTLLARLHPSTSELLLQRDRNNNHIISINFPRHLRIKKKCPLFL